MALTNVYKLECSTILGMGHTYYSLSLLYLSCVIKNKYITMESLQKGSTSKKKLGSLSIEQIWRIRVNNNGN